MNKIIGCSVTQRIKHVKQPRGGYINPRMMEIVKLENDIGQLNSEENVHATLIGLTVDYLTRFMTGTSLKESFEISLLGASIIDDEDTAITLLSDIKGLDDNSIINAVMLTGYDVCFRSSPLGYRSIFELVPNATTIENIRIMVKRSISFLEQYGPKIIDGFTFEDGYTDTVSSGDGDFITNDTLWDFKVSKAKPKKEHTLQLLMYWRMGLHSIHPEFKRIKYLGIYNPRLNTVYRIDVNDISDEIIFEIEKNVIGYTD